MMGRTFRNLSVAGLAGALIGVVVGTLAGMALFPDGPAGGVAAMALGVGAAPGPALASPVAGSPATSSRRPEPTRSRRRTWRHACG
jgi:hypothetical protein